MNLLLLNPQFELVDIIDSFNSVIWTDRYVGYGELEIYTPASTETLTKVKDDYYVIQKDSEHIMIIEERLVTTDVDEGNHITIRGRSLESILERRIVWNQTVLSGNFQNGILKLLNENAIAPAISDRAIPNLIFTPSTNPIITGLTIEAQITGENLYTAISALCGSRNIGFRITLTEDNEFDFQLYAGKDRSYSQFDNPYVIFSPSFDNIVASNYLESKKPLKTVTLVAGEGEGADRRIRSVSVESGSESGLARRELYTDARDISSNTGDVTLSEAEYNAQLEQRGKEDLAENVHVKSFEGQVETSQLFKYGESFGMGDIVQIKNEYGIESKSRITEFIFSKNTSGIDTYPTFTNADE